MLPSAVSAPGPIGSEAREMRRPDAAGALREAGEGPKADFAPVADGARGGLGRLGMMEAEAPSVWAIPGGDFVSRGKIKMAQVAVTAGMMVVPNPVRAAPGGDGVNVEAGWTGLAVAAGWLAGKVRAALGASQAAPRDAALTNSLLEKTRQLQDDVADAEDSPLGLAIAAMSDAILVGDYKAARRNLRTVKEASLDRRMEGQIRLRDSLVAGLAASLPEASLAGSSAMASALKAVRSSAMADPFGVQPMLSRLVQGIALRNVPENLQELQIKLTKKASHEARRRALARPVAGDSILQQKYEDCWPQAFYHMPIPALEPLRRKMTYEQFLAEIEAMFPEKDVKAGGLTMDEFRKVLARHGMKMTSHAPSEAELAALVAKHGAVLGAVGWFDKDVSEMESLKALGLWHQHAVAVVGADAGSFIVRDSLAPSRVRYTMAELDVMSFVAFVID